MYNTNLIIEILIVRNLLKKFGTLFRDVYNMETNTFRTARINRHEMQRKL